MQQELSNKVKGLSPLIGNTPLLSIECSFHGKKRIVYAKAENFNMTGSIKDRMAFHIIKKGYQLGVLKEKDIIIEATSGNTGISFAAIGTALGHPVTIFMPDWMSQERIGIIKSFGAEIKLVTKEQRGFLGSIEFADQLAKQSHGNAFRPNQFSNEDNVEAHEQTTLTEIVCQLHYQSIIPNAFIAGVGTGGTIMGAWKFFKEKKLSVKVHPLEPSNSPTLTTGYKVGKHRIQGISDEFIPSIVNLKVLDNIISIDDGDAIIMAQKLSTQLGLGVGISSGANFLGALKVMEQMDDHAVVVTVFPDSNKKYLSTDLTKEEPIKSEFLSTHVQLKRFSAMKRACYTCCEPSEEERNGQFAKPPSIFPLPAPNSHLPSPIS